MEDEEKICLIEQMPILSYRRELLQQMKDWE